MTQLAKGQRLSLRDTVPTGALQVGLAVQGLPLDFACFGLDSAGKLLSDGDMTFFNQPRTPCGTVQAGGVAGDADGFAFQLHMLSALVERVVIVVSAGGAGVASRTSAGHLMLLENQGEHEFARFEFTGSEFSAEQALMLGEFYRKDGDWRSTAVGQGFKGGLDALVQHFGGTVGEVHTPQATPQPAMNLSSWDGCIPQDIARDPLESDTRCGRAMELIHQFYFPDPSGDARTSPHEASHPVYVMFATGGSASDEALTEKQLCWLGIEPIFWQFMGIGKGGKSKSKLLPAFFISGKHG